MAIISPEYNANAEKQEIVRQHNKAQAFVTYDGAIVSDFFFVQGSKFLHSRVSGYEIADDYSKYRIEESFVSKRLIILLHNIEEQFSKNKNLKSEFFHNNLLNVVKVINHIISFQPDVLKIEATYDNSLFYTTIINGEKYFLEQYLEEPENEEDIEMSLVIKTGEKSSKTIGGKIDDIIRALKVQIVNNKLKFIIGEQSI